jgi:hypothetical protein
VPADSLRQPVMAVVWGRSRFPTLGYVIKYSYLAEQTARSAVLKVIGIHVFVLFWDFSDACKILVPLSMELCADASSIRQTAQE